MRAASGLIRKFLIGLAVVILVLAAITLAVPRLLPEESIRDRIVDQVERATGAKVTLGEAKLQWRWGWQVVLREGTVRGTGDALSAATGHPNDILSFAVDLDEFSLSPALWPLIRKKMVFNSIQLSGGRFVVRRLNDEMVAAGFVVKFADLDLGPAGFAVGGYGRNEEGALSPGERIPPGFSFSFEASADSIVLQGAAYTGVDLDGGFADKTLKVESLSAQRSSGILLGTLNVDYLDNPWGRLEFEVEAERVPASALLEPWVPDIGQRLECDLNAFVIGSLDLRDRESRRRSLALSGLLTAGEGILHAADWLQDVSPYLGARQDLKDIGFGALRHDFRMAGGRYLVEDLSLRGGETDWRGAGWLDPGGAIALEIEVKLPPGFTPDLGNWSFLARSLQDSDGRINLPLKLTGRAARPTVGVDMGRLGMR